MFVSVYYNTFHSLNTLWLQVHMYLEIPLTALSARDRAIPRISLVSNMKLSSNLFPTSSYSLHSALEHSSVGNTQLHLEIHLRYAENVYV